MFVSLSDRETSSLSRHVFLESAEYRSVAGYRRTAVERPILVQAQDHCKPERRARMAAWAEAIGAS